MEPPESPESATNQLYLALICPIKLTNHTIEQLDSLYYESACCMNHKWLQNNEAISFKL